MPMRVNANGDNVRDKSSRILDFTEVLNPSRGKAPYSSSADTHAAGISTCEADALAPTCTDQDHLHSHQASTTPTKAAAMHKLDSPDACSTLGCPPSFITYNCCAPSNPHPDPKLPTPAATPDRPPPQQHRPPLAVPSPFLHRPPTPSLPPSHTLTDSSPPATCPDTPQRFTPAPDFTPELHALDSDSPPGSELDLRLASMLLKPKVPCRRFQVDEITGDSRLEEAARKEMRPKPGEQGALRELEHLQAALEAIDADAAEESRVNREVAALVAQRLEDGRRSLHKLVRLLQGLLAAESAYVAAMHNVSQFLASDEAQPPSRQQSDGGAARRPASGAAGAAAACGSSGPSQCPAPGSGSARGAAGSSTPGAASAAAAAARRLFPHSSFAGTTVMEQLSFGGGLYCAPSVPHSACPALSRCSDGGGSFRGLPALSWALSGCNAPPAALPGGPGSSRTLSRATSTSSHCSAPPAPAPDSPSATPVEPPAPVDSLLTSLSHLPDLVSQSHAHLHGALASLASDCQHLVDGIAEVCRLVGPEAAAAAGDVEAARQALAAAFARHAAACRCFEALLKGGDVKGRLAPERDPWATEGDTARAHLVLQQAQDRERSCLQRTFVRAQGLEAQRLQLSKQAVAAAAGSYRAALLPIQHDLVALTDAAAAADTDAQLAALAAAAAAGADIASQLTAQQAAYIREIRSSLFRSPEIVLQGPLQLLDDPVSQWKTVHFVLTCAGYLHWFQSKEGLEEPMGSLCLARCRFEPGTTHCFHVLEARAAAGAGWLLGAGRPHRFSLQAEREECCKVWAEGVKQAIMLASGRW